MNKLTTLGLILFLNPITMANATESYYYRYGTNQAPAAPATAQNRAPMATAPTATTPMATPIQPTGNANVIGQPSAVSQPITQRSAGATPHVSHYGFYGQKSIQGSGPRFIVGGNPYTPSMRTNQNSYYNSPVLTQEEQAARMAKKFYYLTFRGGIGGTFGWDNGQSNPVKPIFGLVAGTWANQNVRLDAEFDYHLKGKLSKSGKNQATYKQYDLGANAYYDFEPIKFGMTPFIGGGLWLVKKKATGKVKGRSSSSGWRTGLSVSTGLIYPLTNAFSLSAMLRGRYLITSESLYNLEALFGITYSF